MDPTTDAPSTLPDLPATSPAGSLHGTTSPAVDGQGTSTAVPDPLLAARIDGASATAVDQHLATQPAKRRPGQRGADKRPRRPRVPVEEMVNGTFPALVDAQPEPLAGYEADLVPEPTPFDRETASEMAGFVTELLNDVVAIGMEAWALKHLNDAGAAADAANAVRMTDKLQTRWNSALVKLAEKHRIALDWAPEVIAGGCLLVWGSNIRKQGLAVRQQGEQLRKAAA